MFDYYFSFLIWFMYFFFSFCYTHVYLYFFYNNFSSKNILINKSNKGTNTEKLLVSVPQINLNWVMYSWLNLSKKSIFIENNFDNIFFANSINIFWTNNYNFFNRLYRLVFLISLTNNNCNLLYNKLLSFTNFTINNEKFYFLFLNYSNKDKLEILSLYYSFRLIPTYFENFEKKKNITKSYLYNKNNMSLIFQNSLFTDNSRLVKAKSGLFINTFAYFSDLNNFLKNLHLLQITQLSIQKNFEIGKLNRWFYKYFNLNRKLFKNANKLTNLKVTSCSDFITNSNFNRNLWNSHFFQNVDNYASLKSSQYNIFLDYANFYNKSFTYFNENLFSNDQNSNNRDKLKFIENSYFFFIKRIFFTNTLGTNYFYSENKFRVNTGTNISDFKKLQKNEINNLLLYNLQNLDFSTIVFSSKIALNKNNFFKSNSVKYNNSIQRDLYLNFSTNEKFNLNELKFLNSLNNFEVNNFFFMYLNNNNFLYELNSKFNLLKKIKFNNTKSFYLVKKFNSILVLQTNGFFFKSLQKNFFVNFYYLVF